MQDSQTSFLSNCESKNTDQLWQDLTGKIDRTIATFVPTQNSERSRKSALDHTRDSQKDEPTRSLVPGTEKNPEETRTDKNVRRSNMKQTV